MVSTIKIVDTKMGISRWPVVSGIRVNRTGRRTYTVEYKNEVVRKCRVRGVSVSAIALAHGLNANLVRKWMRQQPQRPLPPRVVSPPTILLPVTVDAPLVKRPRNTGRSPSPQRSTHSGSIDIELNGARIRLQGAVDNETLRCVLNALRQQ